MNRYCKIVLFLVLLGVPGNPLLAEGETVKIGAILPLSGSTAVFGLDGKRVLALLPTYLQQNGYKYRYQFILEDGRCGVGNSTITAAQKLINVNKVKFLVIGCSGEVLQAGALANRSKVLAIGFAASHPDIRHLGKYIFRMHIDITKGVRLIANQIKSDLHGKVAILTEEIPFALGIKTELQKQLGSRVGFLADFKADEVDFNTLLAKANNSQPDAYYLNVGSPKTFQILYAQMLQRGIKKPVYAYHVPANSGVLELFGEKLNGVRFIALPESDSSSAEFKKFYGVFLKNYPEGANIEFLLRTSFDASMSIVRAIEAVGPDPTRSKDYLYQSKDLGALGMIAFDEFGDVKNLNYVVKEIVNGKPERLHG